MTTWYISFADPDRPRGTQWLGAAIVVAPDDATTPVGVAKIAGLNPGGEALCIRIDDAIASQIPKPFFDHVLQREDITALESHLGCILPAVVPERVYVCKKCNEGVGTGCAGCCT